MPPSSLASQSVNVRAMLDAWASAARRRPASRARARLDGVRLPDHDLSSAGARGVLQTLPTTREYVETVLAGKTIPHTVDGDVEVGVLLLKHLLDAFEGDERLALAGWYQGERAVRRTASYKVTKPFVANVLALQIRM